MPHKEDKMDFSFPYINVNIDRLCKSARSKKKKGSRSNGKPRTLEATLHGFTPEVMRESPTEETQNL